MLVPRAEVVLQGIHVEATIGLERGGHWREDSSKINFVSHATTRAQCMEVLGESQHA